MNFEYYLKLQKSGDLINAEKGYKLLIKQNKIVNNLFASLGLIHLKTNRAKSALKFFNKELKINPLNTVALNNLGVINLDLKNYRTAKNYFLKALKISPNAETLYFLGLILTELEDYDKAIEFYNKSILMKKNADSSCNIGYLYYYLGSLDKAKKNILDAIKINSKHDAAYNNLGLINMAYGNFIDAKQNFSHAIKCNPTNTKAHFNISKLLNYKDNNEEFKKLLILSKSIKLNEEKKEFLYFALGKALNDKEDHKKSFYYYKKANSLKRSTIKYSSKNNISLFNNIKRTFNKYVNNKFKNCGAKDTSPIFIVGMPRSGTSLIEQVLASHSKVFGAGEITYLDDTINKFFLYKKKLFDSKTFFKKNFYNAGNYYIKKTKEISPDKKYIINKLPLNFRWLGLIKLILPNAIIVHCKRNPMDTCLSVFQQNFFAKGNEYSFKLSEIGIFFNLYIDIMNYWKKILPDCFYEIEYEDFIYYQKKETKKLLDY
jgi:tetratricopeptide (TPR) repeat protein